ncbi:MAG TPA: hypothetical protein VGD37_03130 [Kofleriaceae bacterium]
MTRRALVVWLGVRLGVWLGLTCAAACGDNRRAPGDDDPLAAVSGSRLALQRYRYDDGTEQVAAGEFYDTGLHTLCRAMQWTDGGVRCAPVADDAEYLDASCTRLVGIGRTIAAPTLFVVYDGAPAGGLVAQVFRAGAPAPPVVQYYTRSGGACTGPVAVPPEIRRFYELADEITHGEVVAFHDAVVGDGRIGLVIREGDDGLRVPSGLRDRELGAACTPGRQADGSFACEPTDAPAAIYFRDPVCREPMVAVGATAVPAIARLVEPSGCASYRRVGGEVSSPVYRRDGDACTAVDAPAGGRLFAVEAPLALAALDRSIEAVPGRRLQHMILQGRDGLRFVDDRLLDTALAAECRPRTLRDTIRCIPIGIVPATPLFLGDSCTMQVRVAEVPHAACEPPAYATTSRPFQLRTIAADPAPSPLFRLDGDVCKPYTAAPGTEVRALGPPLDLTTFPSGIYFSERTP